MRKIWGRMWWAGLFLALYAGVAHPGQLVAGSVIRVGGAGTGLGTAKLLADSFMKSHPGIEIKVMPSLGSSGGIKALLKGSLDLALSGRPLTDNERGEGALAKEYARTPFVFVVHKMVVDSSLTTQQLEDIYGGRMQQWSDGGRIRVVMRPAGDTDTALLMGISPAMTRSMKSALGRSGMNFAVTDQENIALVEKVPGGFGASTLTQVVTEKPAVKILAHNGVKPTLEALSKGGYQLFKPLYLVSSAKSSPPAREFAAFIMSPAGRKILLRTGNQPF